MLALLSGPADSNGAFLQHGLGVPPDCGSVPAHVLYIFHSLCMSLTRADLLLRGSNTDNLNMYSSLSYPLSSHLHITVTP